MANYTEEQLLSVIKILAGEKDKKDEDAGQAQAEKEAAEKVAAEAKAKAEAEKEAAKASEEPEAKSDDDDKKDTVAEERENKYIAKTLKAELRSNGVDGDLVDSLSEFISYDTLKSDGEADDEKLKKFAEAVSGIANRKPPKAASDKHDILNPKKEGLARYLPDTDK